MISGSGGTSQNVTVNLKVQADPGNSSVISRLSGDMAKMHAGIGNGAAKAAKDSANHLKSAADSIGSNGSALAARWEKGLQRLSTSSVKAHQQAVAAAKKRADAEAREAERAEKSEIAVHNRLYELRQKRATQSAAVAKKQADSEKRESERAEAADIITHNRLYEHRQKLAAKQQADQQRAEGSLVRLEGKVFRQHLVQERAMLGIVHGAGHGLHAIGEIASGIALIGITSEKTSEKMAKMFVGIMGISQIFQGVVSLLEAALHLTTMWERGMHAVRMEETAITALEVARGVASGAGKGAAARSAGAAENAALRIGEEAAAGTAGGLAARSGVGGGLRTLLGGVGAKIASALSVIGQVTGIAALFVIAAAAWREVVVAGLRYFGIVNEHTQSLVGPLRGLRDALTGWWRASAAAERAATEHAERLKMQEAITKRETTIGEVGSTFRGDQHQAAVRAGFEKEFNAAELERARAAVVDAQREKEAAKRAGNVPNEEKLTQALERLKQAQDHILEAKQKELDLAKQQLETSSEAYSKLTGIQRAAVMGILKGGGPQNERQARLLEQLGNVRPDLTKKFWNQQQTAEERGFLGGNDVAAKQADINGSGWSRLDTARRLRDAKLAKEGVSAEFDEYDLTKEGEWIIGPDGQPVRSDRGKGKGRHDHVPAERHHHVPQGQSHEKKLHDHAKPQEHIGKEHEQSGHIKREVHSHKQAVNEMRDAFHEVVRSVHSLRDDMKRDVQKLNNGWSSTV
jgi:hypothetical protein